MEWLVKLLGGARNPLDSIFEGIDKLTTSKEEKEILRLEALKLEMSRQKQDLDDKDSARNLYSKDAAVQKVYAITFLLGYIGLSAFLIYWMIGPVVLNQVTSNLIFTIFGAMSTKVGTITDFFFGGSSTQQQTFNKSKKDEK